MGVFVNVGLSVGVGLGVQVGVIVNVGVIVRDWVDVLVFDHVGVIVAEGCGS